MTMSAGNVPQTLEFVNPGNINENKLAHQAYYIITSLNTTPVLLTCRPSIITYGMWDQLRVDMGREFCLMLFIQDMLKECRNNTRRLPYIQSTSKEVNIINSCIFFCKCL